jgi:hypothetical protein
MVFFILSISMLVFHYVQTTELANAQLNGKMTSTCTSGGDCITVICIDDHPCETIKTNSNNGTELGDFIHNMTRVTLTPQEVV